MMEMIKIPDTFLTGSVSETRKIGQELVYILRAGDVVSLEGELGAGKTQIVKGFASGMGIDADREVFSPTFSIINIYEGRIKLYHVDLYRLGEDWEELEQTGFFDVLAGGGVALIEWGDRAKNYLPTDSIRIILTILSENERKITILRGWGS
jgi:tRNA threonylcarbamoyladenosine biosynthesis protein TsaE